MEGRISENGVLPGAPAPKLFQSVLDNVGVALAVIDRERRFVFTNQAAFDIFGAAENLSLAEWGRDYKFHDSLGREIPGTSLPYYVPSSVRR
jgi:PAS domain-containing protein